MAPEGISTLPQAPENAPMSFDSALDESKQALAGQFPGEVGMYDQGMEQLIQQLQLPPEELATLKQVLETLLQNEAQYPQLRQRLIAEAGVSPEDIPEEFDRGYLTTMLVVVQEAMRRAGGGQSQTQMPMPQGFAKGGLAGAAESLRQQGRYGDTVLAHINPQEAAMLKAMGGSGTINPATGLPEFFFKAIGNAFKSVGNAVKKVVNSPVGRIIATVALTAALGPAGLGMSTMLAAGVAGTAVSLAGGSNLKQALISGVTSGAMAGLAPQISNMLPGTGGYLNAAATGAIMGAGYGAATGQNIVQSALTGGVLAGGMSAAGGANATGPSATSAGVFGNRPNGPAPVIDRTIDTQGISNLPNAPANQGYTGPDIDYSKGLGANVRTDSTQIGFGNDRYTPEITPTSPTAPTSPTTPTSPTSPTNTPAPNQAASSNPMDYLTKAKDALFSSNPKDPGFFYNDKGNISIPAVAGTALGVGYLTGGFNSTPSAPPGVIADRSVTGETLVNKNPERYIVGGLPGFNAPAVSPNQSPMTASPAYTNQANILYGSPSMQYAPNTPIRFAAKGGISNIYPRKTGKINGPGTGTSDSIPAMLSDGEFVITAKAVRGAGNGSRREGAKKLYRMMHALEKKAGGKI